MTKLGIALLVIGGLFLWNTWIFGWLNHGLAGYTRMSISELNVAGQPSSLFFAITEWLSGLTLLIGAILLIVTMRRGGFILISLLMIAMIGGLTIFDASHPVDCNRFQNQACTLKMARDDVTTINQEHDIETEISEYATMLLGLVLIVWATYHKLSGEEMPLIELLVIVAIIAITIAPLVMSTNNATIAALGQRLWNTFASIEFLYVAYKVRQIHTRPTGYSQRKTRKAIA
jgi:hypothetical protein